ncbi:MAG: RDD family protein [Candidatus Anstonellales archaeon]
MESNEQNLNNQNLGFSNTESKDQVLYASLLDRIIAEIVDGILLTILFFAVSIILGPVMLGAALLGGSIENGAFIVLTIISLALTYSYRVVTEGVLFSATIGKKLMNLKVVDESGNNLTLQKAAIRNAVKVFPLIIPFIGLLVYLASIYLIATSPRKQAIHDMVAQTFVIKNL